MITSLQSGLFGLKSLFAMVTDPAVSLGLSDEQLRLAREHLPWTRLVADDRSTDDQGETVDLLAYYLAARREQLVIKPTDGYGGAGVEIGLAAHRRLLGEGDRRRGCGRPCRSATGAYRHRTLQLAARGVPLQGFTADHNPLLCSGKLSATTCGSRRRAAG